MRSTLPSRRPSVTRETEWNGHPLTVTIGYDRQGRPAEVFANALHGGDMQSTLADASVVISIALQHSIAPDALAKSLARVPAWINGIETTAPASPVGAVMDALLGVAK
jgi:hypothetical protein